MQHTCARCGRAFEAKRDNARFCSERCRTGASRARRSGRPETIASVSVLPVAHEDVGSGVVGATRAELEAACRVDTVLGQAALKLAERIDSSTAVMGFAALVRELRETMVEAVRDAEQRSDALDEIQQRALELLRGTG